MTKILLRPALFLVVVAGFEGAAFGDVVQTLPLHQYPNPSNPQEPWDCYGGCGASCTCFDSSGVGSYGESTMTTDTVGNITICTTTHKLCDTHPMCQWHDACYAWCASLTPNDTHASRNPFASSYANCILNCDRVVANGGGFPAYNGGAGAPLVPNFPNPVTAAGQGPPNFPAKLGGSGLFPTNVYCTPPATNPDGTPNYTNGDVWTWTMTGVTGATGPASNTGQIDFVDTTCLTYPPTASWAAPIGVNCPYGQSLYGQTPGYWPVVFDAAGKMTPAWPLPSGRCCGGSAACQSVQSRFTGGAVPYSWY